MLSSIRILRYQNVKSFSTSFSNKMGVASSFGMGIGAGIFGSLVGLGGAFFVIPYLTGVLGEWNCVIIEIWGWFVCRIESTFCSWHFFVGHPPHSHLRWDLGMFIWFYDLLPFLIWFYDVFICVRVNDIFDEGQCELSGFEMRFDLIWWDLWLFFGVKVAGVIALLGLISSPIGSNNQSFEYYFIIDFRSKIIDQTISSQTKIDVGMCYDWGERMRWIKMVDEMN